MQVNTINISNGERFALYSLYMQKPTLRQSRQLLFSRLFRHGITLISPSIDNYVVDEGFQEILSKFYLPIANSLLDDYFMFGYSHFYLQETIYKGRRIVVPKQLPFGTYTVQMVAEPFKDVVLHFSVNGRMKIDIFATATEESTIFPIVFDTSILPNVNTGKHNSIVSTLVKGYLHSDIRSKFLLQTEFVNAFPKLITKTKSEKNSKATDDLENTIYLSNDERRLKTKAENNLNLQSMRTMAECQVIERRMLNLGDDTLKLQDISENVFQLPLNAELASSSTSVTTGKTDLLDYNIQLDRETIRVIGIPSSFISGKDVSLKNTRGISEIDEKMFFKTVEGYKNILHKVLNEIFKINYPEESEENVENVENEANEAKEENPAKKQKVEKPTTQYIEIPLVNDTLSPETILMLYSEGTIDEEQKRSFLLLSAGLETLI